MATEPIKCSAEHFAQVTAALDAMGFNDDQQCELFVIAEKVINKITIDALLKGLGNNTRVFEAVAYIIVKGEMEVRKQRGAA